MQWEYSDYPMWKNTKKVLTSGTVEIKVVRTAALDRVKMGPHADPNVLPRPSKPVAWRIDGDVPEDLKRFVRGRYWPRIEAALLSQQLANMGMEAPAAALKQLAGV